MGNTLCHSGVSVGQDSHRHAPAACPRCGRTLHEPTAWSSAWRCDWHGEVHPLLPAFSPSRDGLDGLLRIYRPDTAGVPVWLPWPLPAGWLVAGFAGAGDTSPAFKKSLTVPCMATVKSSAGSVLLVRYRMIG